MWGFEEPPLGLVGLIDSENRHLLQFDCFKKYLHLFKAYNFSFKRSQWILMGCFKKWTLDFDLITLEASFLENHTA